MIKYIYLSKTWSNNDYRYNMMDEINDFGLNGWKVIKMIERVWGDNIEMTVYFEHTFVDEDE